MEKKEKSVLLLKVNKEQYQAFKLLCANENYTMTGVLNAYIRKCVKNQDI